MIDASLPERQVEPIPLTLDLQKAEISGLAWCGENLLILPQYPEWQHQFRTGMAVDKVLNFVKDAFENLTNQEHSGLVAVIPKTAILDFIDGKSTTAITPHLVPFITNEIETQIKGFQGFEALGISENRFFVTIEAEENHKMCAYLVGGHIAPDLSKLELDTSKIVRLEAQAEIENASYETLVTGENKIIVIYEANGANVNPQPKALVFDFDLNPLEPLNFPNIEYRITDASNLDEQNCFWVMNYYFPGSKDKYKPAQDEIAAKYGADENPDLAKTVERLVQFQYTEEKIILAETKPIQLKLLSETTFRNWEGLVRLDERGFLIITDRFPTAILGFVAA